MKAPDTQIAVTLYNLRDYCKTESDLDKTLDKVCEIGYQAVQVSGTPLAADVIKRQLDRHNLFCCATHEGIDTLKGTRPRSSTDSRRLNATSRHSARPRWNTATASRVSMS